MARVLAGRSSASTSTSRRCFRCSATSAVKAMTANGIVDYLILIDGDLQQLPEGSEHGKPMPGHLLGEPRRRSNLA